MQSYNNKYEVTQKKVMLLNEIACRLFGWLLELIVIGDHKLFKKLVY